MAKKSKNNFYYRVKIIDKNNNEKRYLAEIESNLDENARRSIIGKTITEGGRVLSIVKTEDKTTYPGESNRRKY